MMKFTRDMTTHLFKFVRKVDIRLNPFDGRTGSAKELLRQVMATRYREANPKLEIVKNFVATPDAPRVSFEFVDGSEKTFDSSEYIVDEMLMEVFIHANELDIEYEIADKSIDDQM